MDIGQRLKQARLEAGLSQRQLCGEKITRNMLSQIENGSARPSMDTLSYFAKTLGKPLSFFLEEDVQPGLPHSLAQARQAYNQKDFSKVLELLAAPEADFAPESYLLLALSRLELAKQALSQNQQKYACKLLAQAAQDGSRTPYYTPSLEQERLLLLYQADPSEAAAIWEIFPKDPRKLLLQANASLDTQQPGKAIKALDAEENRSASWYLLRGQAAMQLQDYTAAISCLSQAEPQFPELCIPALEICYRELGDFKMAYAYACKQK